MAFDVNPQTDSIDITPLVSYETGMFADEFCVFRLVFARPEDAPGTGSVVIQKHLLPTYKKCLSAFVLAARTRRPMEFRVSDGHRTAPAAKT